MKQGASIKVTETFGNYLNNGECLLILLLEFFFPPECISGITRSSFFFLHILSNHMMQEKPPYVTFLLTLILSYPGD